MDTERRTVTVRPPAPRHTATRPGGEPPADAPHVLPYDELVLAPGSITRALPIPGLAENGIGFRTVEEAIGLRNHVLEQLDIAASTRDTAVRDAALTFLVVGAGYAGVEALAELEDMARHACRSYPSLRPDEQKWLLVEATDRVLPEAGPDMGAHALRELRRRNVDVRLTTRLESCTGRTAVLSDGTRHPTRTIVWTAGVRPHPVLASFGVPLDDEGRVRCAPDLRVEDTPHVWAAGDAAAVPDPTAPDPGTRCAPNAQHAVHQARRLADNIAAVLTGGPTADYRHRQTGAVASLGLHRGIARVRGRRLTGRAAWLVHRVYHLLRMPTGNRKARVLAEWTLAGLFRREIVSLGSLEHPRAGFELAARTPRDPEDA